MSTNSGGYREITITSVVLGIVTGSLMAMAFVYMSLKLGFSAAGSEVAAIVGFLILRWILKKGTVLENNINQTIASAITASSSGVIFTVPSLLLLGKPFNPFVVGLAAIAGSVLGITIILPLRKQMLEFDRLRFPSGVAVATILKTPGAGKGRALLLIMGFVTSLILVVFIKLGSIPAEIPLGHWLGLPDYIDTSIALSLMNIGAGLLSGSAGLPLAFGGILAYWIITPVSAYMKWVPPTDQLNYISTNILDPIGIGMLVGSALMGVILALPSIRNAFVSLSTSARMGIIKEQVDESSPRLLKSLFVASFVVLFVVTYFAASMSVGKTFVVTMVGVLWITLSGIIVAQCAGTTDISPLSGLSLIAVALIYKLTDGDIVTSVIISVAVCVAISQSSRMMQDLKAGFIVGAIPFRQQIVQYSTSIIGPVVSMVVMYILWETIEGYPGFGPSSMACIKKTSDCLPAPQAVAMKSMIESMWNGSIPFSKYIAGSVLGAIMSIIPIGSIGILVGLALYLPFHITLGYSIGCMATIFLIRFKGNKFYSDVIVPVSVGLILGEALSEIAYSVFQIIN